MRVCACAHACDIDRVLSHRFFFRRGCWLGAVVGEQQDGGGVDHSVRACVILFLQTGRRTLLHAHTRTHTHSLTMLWRIWCLQNVTDLLHHAHWPRLWWNASHISDLGSVLITSRSRNLKIRTLELTERWLEPLKFQDTLNVDKPSKISSTLPHKPNELSDVWVDPPHVTH